MDRIDKLAGSVLLVSRSAEMAEIAARHEGAARCRDDDHPDLFIGHGSLDGRAKTFRERDVERIQLFGPVETDVANGAMLCENHRFDMFGHQSVPFRVGYKGGRPCDEERRDG